MLRLRANAPPPPGHMAEAVPEVLANSEPEPVARGPGEDAPKDPGGGSGGPSPSAGQRRYRREDPAASASPNLPAGLRRDSTARAMGARPSGSAVAAARGYSRAEMIGLRAAQAGGCPGLPASLPEDLRLRDGDGEARGSR